jgi:hypothetical protein
MVYQAMNEPFCEATGDWLKFHQVGTVSKDRRTAFMQQFNNGYYAEAAELMKDDRRLRRVQLYVMVGRCQNDSPEAMIRVKEQQGRYQKPLVLKTVSASEFQEFMSALNGN